MSAFKLLTDLVRSGRSTHEKLAEAALESLQTILQATRRRHEGEAELAGPLAEARAAVAPGGTADPAALRHLVHRLSQALEEREQQMRITLEAIDQVAMAGVGALQLEDVSRQTLQRAEGLAEDLGALLEEAKRRANESELDAREASILAKARASDRGLIVEGDEKDVSAGPAVELF